jgi:hypothetical protein
VTDDPARVANASKRRRLHYPAPNCLKGAHTMGLELLIAILTFVAAVIRLAN